MKSVNAVPTFHFYKNGVVVDQMSGANVTILESKLKMIKKTHLRDYKHKHLLFIPIK